MDGSKLSAARDPMLDGAGKGLSPGKGFIPASQGGLPEKLFLSPVGKKGNSQLVQC